MTEVNYNKLRLDVLQKMIQERGIECKMKKDEMVKMLKLYDEGEYKEPIKETQYQKDGNGFLVGIDIKNSNHILQAGKLIEKKEGRHTGKYYDNRVWYWLTQKLI
jgi:SMC interacting uncharacterized protein involved in chromosome segregation